jgi:hypothetical protein
VEPPTAGACVAGPSGVTAVPPGESDCPVALVPPVETGGPTGTFGAPGRDDDGVARGDGVVKDGTVTEAGGMPTISADGVPTGASGDTGALPRGAVVVAPDVPVGAGTLEVVEVPGAGAVEVGDAVVADTEPVALPLTPSAVGPGGAVGCACVVAPT